MGEGTGRDTRRRLTVSEAAAALGVTIDAVRSRVKRGTIAHVRESGRVYVLLGTDQPTTSHDQPTDLGEPGSGESSTLISELRDQVAYLREENRRKDEIIMQQAITMRALTSPSEPSESLEAPAEDVGGDGHPAPR